VGIGCNIFQKSESKYGRETAGKWLRRDSKIFSAKKTTRDDHDSWQTINVLSGKAENI
jgi:hypothetical protein